MLDHFWVDPGSLGGQLGIVLASFCGRFGVVLTSFSGLLGHFGPLFPILGHFYGHFAGFV